MPISATYRLQFNKDFTFRAAGELLGYLSDLGITHLYASPILRSRKGSTHGYDVIDPTRWNPELGDFHVLREELRQHGIGLLLDVVPNHMAATSENAWWMDVLEYGPASAYASYFDIDWHPPSRPLEGKILLPFLERPFAEVLENRELALRFVDGKFFVQYFEWLFPVAPRSYPRILAHRLETLKHNLGEHSTAFQEYAGIAAAAATLSERHNSAAARAAPIGETRLQFEQLAERLRQLALNNADVRTLITQTLEEFAGSIGHPASFSLLERLLAEQFYVLAYWQNLNQEINYRRFFAITDLVGMRVEDPLVFEATHSLVTRMIEEDAVCALRVDHLDGLRDPVGYLNRLHERIAATSPSANAKDFLLYVEKILSRMEALRADWPVAGTTGYDFLNAVNALFVHPTGARALERVYFRFLDRNVDYDGLLYQQKKLVMGTLFAAELRSLSHQLALLASQDRYARDVPLTELRKALHETTARLSVYRTYIRNLEVGPEDRAVIEQAVATAQGFCAQLHPMAFPFIRDVFLLHNPPHLLPDQREARLAFVMRWQQFTGPIMAKAFEDTLLYVYNPLISLNEVGGDPRPAAASRDYFQQCIHERLEKWPHSLNATTTHDTKRSEDVRARINVLSEIPEEWEARLRGWSELNARHKTEVQGQMVPDRNEEIFLYQTLIGMWPLAADEHATVLERLEAYAVKATREAMVHTRWTLPSFAHEQALKHFIAQILACGDPNGFLRDFTAFHEGIAYCAMLNGLSQTLLKILSPGVPDFYQGSELWDFRLVDPDNRQPVDFAKRKAELAQMQSAQESMRLCLARELANNWRDGRIKMYVIWRALTCRRQNAELFLHGEFVSLEASGTRRGNVTSYCRRYGEQAVVVVLPWWLAATHASESSVSSDDFWSGTRISLPASETTPWRSIFTGETFPPTHSLPIAGLLRHFPVAMLEGSNASG